MQKWLALFDKQTDLTTAVGNLGVMVSPKTLLMHGTGPHSQRHPVHALIHFVAAKT
jgi:hypothetical protein